MAQAKKTVMFVNQDPLIYRLFKDEMEDEFKDEVKTVYFDDCDAAVEYLDSNKVDVVVSSVAFHKLPFG
jgi:ABC-type phosphate/phosphonate transport system substrate-binding protein